MHSTMNNNSATSGRSTPHSCSSTPSQPIQMGFNPTRMANFSYEESYFPSNASYCSTTSSSSTSSASSSSSTPSPYGSSCLQRNAPSSYFSDEELFGDDQEAPFLDEAPAPPRGAEAWLAQARAQGHAPPASPVRQPIVIKRRSAMASTPINCSAD